MKTLYCLVVSCFFLMIHPVVGQQEDRLLASANLGPQTVSVNQLVSHLNQLEGIQLSYSKERLPEKEIEISVADLSVQDLLNLLAEKGGLTIKYVGKNIILKPIQQEMYTISGFITDEASGEVMIGTTVQVKGTQKGSISNVYGFYSITLPKGDYTLIYSSVGFQARELPIVAKSGH